MKPLVNYCRWQGVSLRLRGRNDTAVWGHLVTKKEDIETSQPFHFDLNTWQLRLDEGENRQLKQLDEMGIVIEEKS